MSQATRGADSTSVRRWNEYAVIEALHAADQKRVSELAQLTGMTPASLGEVLRSLMAKGWVEATDPLPGGMGRPAQLYGLATPRGAILGLDIGGRTVRGAVLSLTGEEILRSERRYEAGAGSESCRAAVRAVVDECLEAVAGPVWLTAVAVAGVVDGQGRISASTARPDWVGRHLPTELGPLLPSRAFVIGDTRAALFAEHKRGAAHGVDDFVLIKLSRRPSLGLFLNGRTHPGVHGAAGVLDWNQSLPKPTALGWLAPFMSDPDPLGSAVEAALAGDRDVLAGVTDSICGYVPVIAVAAAMVDPELVVLGGGLTPILPGILDRATEEFAANAQFPPRLVVSHLDRFGVALGAALMGCEIVFDALSDPNDGVLDLTVESFEQVPLPAL